MTKQRTMGQYMTPQAIAEQMCGQIQRPVGEWKVLDPACGDGNLLLAAIEIMRQAGAADIPDRITGIDIDAGMVSSARIRIAQELGCSTADVRIFQGDFLGMLRRTLFSEPKITAQDFNVIIANPPYGQLREYRFFEECDQFSSAGTEIVFLVPLAFLDRVTGIDFVPLPGRPLGVTTGHAIVHHVSGQPYRFRRVMGARANARSFTVLTGVKLYALGAGTPPQSKEVVESKPYSSTTPRTGWLPCLRTGDIHPFSATIGRLWVDYGPHLAHPKDIDRFVGPRIFVRRVPIWQTRQLGAAYIEDPALCAGDVLIIRHVRADRELLKGLCVYLNSPEAAETILRERPSLRYRTSFPKISAKDLNVLIDEAVPNSEALYALAGQCEVVIRGVSEIENGAETNNHGQ